MSTDFIRSSLTSMIHEDESGSYIMIEFNDRWIVLKHNNTTKLLGDNMTEVDAMKIVDFHVRQTMKEACEHGCKKCTCNHG